MYIVILITFVVIFVSLWIVNKNYKYVYAQAQAPKPPSPKPLAPKPPSPKPLAPRPPKPSTLKPPAPKFTIKPPTHAPTNGLKYKGVTKAPTYERLQKALAAYTKNNKSGKVQKDSVYADLVQAGYLKFQNGTWTSSLKPAGKPRV